MKKITLPKSINQNQLSESVRFERGVVVIGANGSGKTRLGTWMEFSGPDNQRVYRISAQRSLAFPKDIRPTDISEATLKLACGLDGRTISRAQIEANLSGFRRVNRWGDSPETFLLNDYEALAVLLFSENYEQTLKYMRQVRASERRIDPPKTKLDMVKEIWDYVLPHRTLVLHASVVAAVPRGGGDEYAATQMSDGERVAFYLIGQCMCAAPDAIVIIDEPEVHLHRAIQAKLWDAIEAARPDCTFVYLTHDLTFASERAGCAKVCLRSYDGASFDWYEVPETEGISEDMLLEVLGSRKPVLFVEGVQGSHDLEVYQCAFPEHTVKPLGSCEKVIEAVKAFNSLEDFHHIACNGIVDRDYRDADELAAYERHGVYAPRVAEVENLFLLEEVLRAVAEWQRLDNPEGTLLEIKAWVIAEFDKFKEKFALEATRYKVNLALNSFGGGGGDISGYLDEFANFTGSINPREKYEMSLEQAVRAVRVHDYGWVIANFNHKSLVNQVGRFYDLKPSTYVEKVKMLISKNEFGILDGLRAYLPQL
ncbi:AAA family ATPase [Burkholderia seminalis]|uniref:AAA family ATPase n=1 Tax=Burkholderia seminalis TaxID=488731 RepID=UPI001903AC47|nr:AAA family ATPase [Burkholderia seminalis]MBJ9968521.1 AAA family ATPase [Burkholderia seminalis]